MSFGTEVGLVPGDIVLDGDPAPPREGTQHPPTFGPMSVVAERSPISATAELLFWFRIDLLILVLFAFIVSKQHKNKIVNAVVV